MFLGRVMGFNGRIVEVDRLGLLASGPDRQKRYQLRRIAKDPPGEPKLQEPPVNHVIVQEAAKYFVTRESIYYLEPRSAFPFNSRLLYLPTGREPGVAARSLLEDVHHILGEWDDWLYVLRLHEAFDRSGLDDVTARSLRATEDRLWEGGSSMSGFWWRFRYDLLRVRRDGTSESIGEVSRAVATVFDGYAYGRDYDRESGEMRIVRTAVSGGPTEVLYARRRGRSGRGGVTDHLGELAVDRDGIFFYNAVDGTLRKLAHGGGDPEVVQKGLAFYHSVRLSGDYYFVGDWLDEGESVKRKDGGEITWRDKTPGRRSPLRNPAALWGGEYWATNIEDNELIVMGRSSWDLGSGAPGGFLYRFLPGGTVDVRTFRTREGHAWVGPMGVDDECIYYTRTDDANTWFYARPRPRFE